MQDLPSRLIRGCIWGAVSLNFPFPLFQGGYNLESISESMTMCTRSLLGDPLPPLGRLKAPHPSALQSLANAAAVHRKYWASLRLEGELSLSCPPLFLGGKCSASELLQCRGLGCELGAERSLL